MTDTPAQIAILMPLMNDWESFADLLRDLDNQVETLDMDVDIHVIDDYSTPLVVPSVSSQHIRTITSTRLIRNLGHQRAIAIGLVKLVEDYHYDYIVIMDSDGEDCPSNVVKLLEIAIKNPDSVVVAQRQKRSENYLFRLFYFLYKQIFKTLTGKNIDFGNFCVIPGSQLPGLIAHNELWNHLAATLVASRIPLVKLPTRRCTRYSGSSSMNFTRLVIHGLSAISLFLEEITVRVLIFSLVLGFFASSGIIAVIVIRLITDLAIPGWATSAVGILSIVLGQSILFVFFIVLNILQARSNFQVLSRKDILQFIETHAILTSETE